MSTLLLGHAYARRPALIVKPLCGVSATYLWLLTMLYGMQQEIYWEGL
jgi:hypothetical protein